jgi:hypothetical protein
LAGTARTPLLVALIVVRFAFACLFVCSFGVRGSPLLCWSFSDSGEEDYVLEIGNTEANPYGVFALKQTDIMLDKSTVADIIQIYLPVWDVRDSQKKKYSAVLDDIDINAGASIRITMPSTPLFLLDHAEEIHALEEEDLCELTCRKHKETGTAIRNNAYRRSKDLLFRLPGSMQCTNKHFNKSNKTSDNTKLKTHFRMLTIEDDDSNTQDVAFNMWRLVIDGTERPLQVDDEEDDDDDVAAARQRMSNLNLLKAADVNNMDDDE